MADATVVAKRGIIQRHAKIKTLFARHGRHATSMCDPYFMKIKHDSNLSIPDSRNKATTITPASISSKQPHSSSPQQTLNLYTTHTTTTQRVCNVYLQTACAFVSNNNSNGELFVRIVMDGGSQMSFVKSAVARRLKLPSIGSHNLSVIPFGSDKPKPNKLCNRVRLTMRSQYSNRTVVVDAIEVPDICLDVLAVPSDEIAVSIKEFCLADARVGGHDPEGGISILIGADSY